MRCVILLSVIVILLAGCVNTGDEHTPITDVDFRQGIKEVNLEFLPNSPPDKVYEQSDFEIGFILSNEGGYDATEGYIAIGIEKHYMKIEPDTEYEDDIYYFGTLERRSIQFPSGEQIVKSFDAEAKKMEELDRMSEYHDSNIFLNVCYRYATRANPSICIDTDPYNLRPQEKPCNAETYTYSGQGAPIAITEIQEEMLPDGDYLRPSFLIFIENKGRGQTTDPRKTEAMCSSEALEKGDLNTVYLKKMAIGSEEENRGFKYALDENYKPLESNEIECTPNPLRLKKERDYIRCYVKPQSEIGDKAISKITSPYMTPMTIELDYGYTFTVPKVVRVQRILTS